MGLALEGGLLSRIAITVTLTCGGETTEVGQALTVVRVTGANVLRALDEARDLSGGLVLGMGAAVLELVCH
jgi:hypothetical protein